MEYKLAVPLEGYESCIEFTLPEYTGAAHSPSYEQCHFKETDALKNTSGK